MYSVRLSLTSTTTAASNVSYEKHPLQGISIITPYGVPGKIISVNEDADTIKAKLENGVFVDLRHSFANGSNPKPQTVASQYSEFTKKCQACGKSFTKPSHVSTHVWVNRKFCSRQCTVKDATSTKVCERCGNTYAKPLGLAQSRWAKRKYCSQECNHDEKQAATENTCIHGHIGERRRTGKRGTWYCAGCVRERNKR